MSPGAKIGNKKGWFRVWVALTGLSFIALVGGIIWHHFNTAPNVCLALMNFEHVIVNIPPGAAASHPSGIKYSTPRDITKEEIAAFLMREMSLDAVSAERLSKTARLDIDDNDLDFSGKTTCPSGYAVPAIRLQTEEPYATQIRNNHRADTLALSKTLLAFWLFATAAVAAMLVLVLWVIRGFEQRDAFNIREAVPSQPTESALPVGEHLDTETKPLAAVLEGNESRTGYILEVFLHLFAASLAVPIAKAGGFGGAIPVVVLGLGFAAISVGAVRIVKKITNKAVQKAAFWLLPVAYFLLYLAAYVAIRSL